MRLPYPVFLDRVLATITITNGLDSNGVPAVVKTVTTKVTFNEQPKTRYDKDGKMTSLQGKILMLGDVAPEVGTIEGYVDIKGVLYQINRGIRCRNPDGTIHHTELELM